MAGKLDGGDMLATVDGPGVDDPAFGVQDHRRRSFRFTAGIRHGAADCCCLRDLLRSTERNYMFRTTNFFCSHVALQ
ncbi:hypothetical protein ACH4VR_37830 [Streptomyces sp. NPDC020883]|uniref:hypothetical protein n=1 Tax=Streptomyces sp. NPDC020883 TaxID=3365099 RepID=UPI0037A14811